MLPKFELAPILIYLVMLPNTLRPSITPSPSTANLFEQDDVRGVLGDVGRAVHGYADVRGLQRLSVVDAIAKESDDVPLPVQGVDDRSLLRRRHLGEHRSRLGEFCQLVW